MSSASHNSAVKLKVLTFLSGDDRARTEREQREIQLATDAAVKAGRLELRQVADAKSEDIFPEITKENPTVLHFAGHGDAQGNHLILGGKAFSVNVLADFLAGTSRHLRVLVVSACNVGANDSALGSCCDFLIGCKAGLHDSAAICFAKGFYRELSTRGGDFLDNDSIRACVASGKAEVRSTLPGLNDGASPSLLVEPKNLREQIKPVDRHDHDVKCKVFYGHTTALSGKFAGVIANVGGLSRSIYSDRHFLLSLTGIRDRANDLSRARFQAIPPSSAKIGGAESASQASLPDLLITLQSQLKGLTFGAENKSELQDVEIPTGVGRWEIFKTILLCKLENTRFAHEAVPWIDEFLLAATQLQRAGSPTKSTASDICDLAKSLALSSQHLIEYLSSCLEERIFQGENAPRKFGKAPNNQKGADGFLDVLYPDGMPRPGSTLWHRA